MSLDATGVNLAHSDNVYDLFLSTLAELPAQGDEISEHIPLYNYLKEKKLIKKKGHIGPYIPILLMDKHNPTVQWVSGYDDAISKPADVLNEGKAQYGHLTGRLMTNREEQIKNQGNQLVDLIESKRKQLRIDLTSGLSAGLMSSDEADGKKITGLARIMDEGSSVHGLDPAKYDYWKPTVVYKTGTTKFSLATELREGQRKLYRKQRVAANGTSPDVVLMGEDVFDAHQAWVETKTQIQLKEAGDGVSPSIMGDVMFEHNGRTFIYSEDLDPKEVWSLNFREALELRAHSGTYFYQTPWKDDPKKVQTIFSDNLTYLSLFCTNRKALGKIIYQ